MSPQAFKLAEAERRIERLEATNHDLLEALKDIRRTAKTDPTNLPVKMFAGDIAARATAAIERAKEA